MLNIYQFCEFCGTKSDVRLYILYPVYLIIIHWEHVFYNKSRTWRSKVTYFNLIIIVAISVFIQKEENSVIWSYVIVTLKVIPFWKLLLVNKNGLSCFPCRRVLKLVYTFGPVLTPLVTLVQYLKIDAGYVSITVSNLFVIKKPWIFLLSPFRNLVQSRNVQVSVT